MMIQKLFIAIGIMTSTFAFSEIKEIHSLEEIKSLISCPSSANEWIVFDVDYTLTAPNHPALQMSAIKLNKQRLKMSLQHLPKKNKS